MGSGTVTANSTRSITLSVLVPVYNERYLVAESLGRLETLASDEHLAAVEIIVVDDGSTDGTQQVLEEFARSHEVRTNSAGASPKFKWRFIRHEHNRGKGRAVQTALAEATGDACVIHDADLEYLPSDISRMLKVYIEHDADAVFGSRFAGSEVRRVLLHRHELANKLLTFLCDTVSNLNLTDVWTCYKLVRTPLLKSIPLVSNDFRLEPELAIKLAKREARIFEIPISYFGRTYAEGKKINWRDGARALGAIARFGLSDAIYRDDEYGSQILSRLARARRFNLWMADAIRPYLGDRVLEIGSGVGNLSRALLPRAHANGAKLVMHADAALAARAGADGVHLSSGVDAAASRAMMGPERMVGISIHTVPEAAAINPAHVDYVLAGPAFETASKPGYGPEIGRKGLAEIAQAARVPVLAIGGVNAARLGELIAAGAAGVAVMGGVMRAADPAQEVAALIATLRGAVAIKSISGQRAR